MTRHLRLVLGLGIAAALPFAPWVTRSEGLTLSAAALTYVIGSWVVEAIAARRPGFPARALIPLLGLVVITVVMVAIPRTLEAGLALFVLGVAFSTYVAGRTLGLWLSVGAVSAAVGAVYLAPEADRVDGATLLAFAMVVPLVAVVVFRRRPRARHRHRPDHRAALHRVARRADPGRERTRPRRDVLVHDAGGGRRPRRLTAAAGGSDQVAPSLRLTKNVPVPVDTSSPSASRIAVSR